MHEPITHFYNTFGINTDEIQEIIQSYAKDEGYTVVIDSSAQSFNGIQVLLYTDVKLDISNKILDLLNKGKK